MDRRFTRDQVAALRGQPVYDRDGDKIGDIKEIFFDKSTGEPEWLGISSGFLGTKTVLAPIVGASLEGDGVRVPYTKDQVKDTPDIDTREISETDERALYMHYGIDYSERRSESQLPESGPARGMETPRAMETGTRTRETDRDLETGGRIEVREEELRAQKQSVEAGEVEIRKEVVAEQRTIEVPVTREEVYIERRPVEGREVSDRPIGEGESIRVPVREEEVTVEKTPVVREEIEIGKRAVTETQEVSGTVRREEVRVEREGDVDIRGAATGGTTTGGWQDVMPRYRSNWEQRYGSGGGRWEDYEPGYRYGWEMSNESRYRGRSWTEVEPELRRDWETRHRDTPWDRARDSIRDAWENIRR